MLYSQAPNFIVYKQMKRHDSNVMSWFTNSTVLEALSFAHVVSQPHAGVRAWLCSQESTQTLDTTEA